MSLFATPERDAAIDALLASGERRPWDPAMLRRHAGRDSDLLFPDGALDLVEGWAELADRRMEAEAALQDIANRPGTTSRVRSVIMLRLDQAAPHRDAVRHALEVLATRAGAATATRMTARTVDSIWRAAGDRSADFSWYTKRAMLSAVYGPTLLYWASGRHDRSDTERFLDRGLAGVGRVGRLVGKVRGAGR